MLFVLNSNMVWAACDSGVDVCLEQQPARTIAPSTGSNSTDTSSTGNSSIAGSVAESTASVSESEFEVDRLVNDITADLKARRLTKPAGNNALTKINRLKKVAPAHDYSINGRRYVARIYLSLARNDLRLNRVDRAALHHRTAADIYPSLPGLQTVEDQLNGVKTAPRNLATQSGGTASGEASRRSELADAKQPVAKSTVGNERATQADIAGDGVLITPVMIGLPAGSFVMGSESGANNEKPAHEVTLEAFSMSRYEITREQFYAFKVDTGAEIDGPDSDAALLPVSGVTAQEAIAYTRWLSTKTGKNYRLPTEREWEYAVRAGTTSPYHSGDAIFGAANCLTCLDEIPKSTTPVGTFEPNSFGLYDMHGNVSEWTSSCMTDDYFDYEASRQEKLCPVRVVRGGSWRSTRDQVRSSFRAQLTASGRSMDTGFRVVHDGL